MKQYDEILELLSELQGLFKQNSMPMPNEALVRRIDSLCRKMANDAYICEKAGEIMANARQYYSVRKHQTYPGGSEALFHQMAVSLPERIKCRAANLWRTPGRDEGVDRG